MHDEMCRKCGGTLTNWSLCSECRKPIKRICLKCGSQTEEIIHSLCFYHVEPLQIELSTGLGTVEIEKKDRVILDLETADSDPLLSGIT